jgi:hypothetical protein
LRRAADREFAGDGRSPVLSEVDACRAEAEQRVCVCVEEVAAADDVLAELGRRCDRDGLDARLPLERDRAVVGGELCVDVAKEARNIETCWCRMAKWTVEWSRSSSYVPANGCTVVAIANSLR